MNSPLAFFGGAKVIQKPFRLYNSIGNEELEAASAVIRTGCLSKFLGLWNPDFYGGDKIRTFEKAWSDHFRVPYAIAVNSNTSGLIAAIGAIGIEPGDEVIVSPWTMSASATAILVWNAIPVFADIEDETFNLDPVSVERNVTPYTKAIIVPDIFGHPADLDVIMDIGRRHNLKVIEDCAQAPESLYKGRFAGTVADIGVYSLNYHKHIHTGEGGVCVTNDALLAERLQLIRNHAEAVVEDKGVNNLSNMIGFNFRMTEIEAAIGIEQLKKLCNLVKGRISIANRITEGIAGLKGLRGPIVKEGCSHVYYVYPLIYDYTETGVSRNILAQALCAEGVPITARYENLHLLPMYQKRIAYGRNGFPWTSSICRREISYDKGICPVAEELQDNKYIGLGMCTYEYTDYDIDLIIHSFRKIWLHMDDLK